MEFRGLDQLVGALKKRASLDDVKKTVQLNGSEMHTSAMRSAPVDTGNLKRSIELETKDQGFTSITKPTAHYAPYVEYGTRFMGAQPFIRPSFYKQRTKFINDMQKLMR